MYISRLTCRIRPSRAVSFSFASFLFFFFAPCVNAAWWIPFIIIMAVSNLVLNDNKHGKRGCWGFPIIICGFPISQAFDVERDAVGLLVLRRFPHGRAIPPPQLCSWSNNANAPPPTRTSTSPSLLRVVPDLVPVLRQLRWGVLARSAAGRGALAQSLHSR